MPTYEYECGACGHGFEEFQSITAEKLSKCPACGKKKLERLIGAGGAVLFKGSGFYQTDYRSQEYTDKAKADSSPAPGDSAAKPDAAPAAKGDATSDATGAAKADAKPAAKSDGAPKSEPKTASKSATKPKKRG